VLEVAEDGVGLSNNDLLYFPCVVCVRRLLRRTARPHLLDEARAAAVQDGPQVTALAAAIKASGQTKKGLHRGPPRRNRARDGCTGLGLIAAVVCAIPAMVVVVSVAEMTAGVGLVAASFVNASVIGDAS